MPLDGTTLKPDLQMLPTILRDRSLWPPGHKWDYGNCDQCALGLLRKLRDEEHLPFGMLGDSTELHFFDMPVEDFAHIFLGLSELDPPVDIQPEDVADAIDAYLARPASPAHFG